MARCIRNFKTVTKTVETKVPDGVTLRLTDDEANRLCALLGACTHGYFTDIWRELVSAGFEGQYRGTINLENFVVQ